MPLARQTQKVGTWQSCLSGLHFVAGGAVGWARQWLFLVTISAMLPPITGTYRSRFCLMARASGSGIAAKLSGVRR